MINLKNKMPVTKVLLLFSYLIASYGVGVSVGGSWMLFKFKDMNSFIYGFCILIGCLFSAALVRMFADIGQIIFDLRVDFQRSSKQAGELDQRLNQELRSQLEIQANALNKNLQLRSDSLNQKLQLQINTLNQDLQVIINKLQGVFAGAGELGKKLAAIKDSFNQMNCDSKDMNQNIRQIKVFFEQIERHLDLKK